MLNAQRDSPVTKLGVQGTALAVLALPVQKAIAA